MVLFEDDGLDDGMYLPWTPKIEYQDLPMWMLGLYQHKEDSLGTFLKGIILGWESYISDIEEEVQRVFELVPSFTHCPNI
jgi:hypothetical protein